MRAACRGRDGLQGRSEAEIHGSGAGHGAQGCRGDRIRCCQGALGHAAELPPAAQVAEDAGEDPGQA